MDFIARMLNWKERDGLIIWVEIIPCVETSIVEINGLCVVFVYFSLQS